LSTYSTFPLSGYDTEMEEEIFSSPVVFKSYILTIPAKTFRGNSKEMGIEIARLTTALHADKLIFLGDSETPWLYQTNDYKPVHEAQQYLSNHKIGKRFNGAIQVDLAELPVFIKHLCWLVRCNAALPSIHFIDPEQNIVGNICQYGNLHISTLNSDADRYLNAFINQSEFFIGNNNSCTGRFGPTSAIHGRKTVL
jgi:hypothetical protein